MIDQPTSENASLTPGLFARAGFGGALMGLANLVPGISGGTMLLAAGIYPRFIEAVGDLTRLRLNRSAVAIVGAVVAAALVAVVALAGPVKDLVVGQRWIMYALFIGLTLGGVPTVWRLIRERGDQGAKRPAGSAVWGGAVAGLLLMVGLVIVQSGGGGGDGGASWPRMLLAGVAGASAMILPGVSGGYLLLVIGAYVPILAAIDGFKAAARAGDVAAAASIGTSVLLPVAIGVVIGVAGVSNALRWLLHRYRGATLGVLLGLLVGAVAGLYPFQRGEPPQPGDTLKGQAVVLAAPDAAPDAAAATLVYDQTREPVEPDDYPVAFFSPEAWQVAAAAGLILAGFLITMGIDRLGAPRKRAAEASNPHATPGNPPQRPTSSRETPS